jgi:pantetheine-phosphate adenylyltransferase
MLKAAFPGSFDPPTLGHLNIIERAASIFGELIVLVAENRQKKYLFSADERVSMLRKLVSDHGNISISKCDMLIVDFLNKNNIRLLVRGIRGMSDFSYEFELSMMNKALDSRIDTVFLTCDPEFLVLRSSAIREVASFHGNVSGMVPVLVAEELKKKFN